VRVPFNSLFLALDCIEMDGRSEDEKELIGIIKVGTTIDFLHFLVPGIIFCFQNTLKVVGWGWVLTVGGQFMSVLEILLLFPVTQIISFLFA